MDPLADFDALGWVCWYEFVGFVVGFAEVAGYSQLLSYHGSDVVISHSLIAPLSPMIRFPSLIVGNFPSGWPDASLNSSGAFWFTRSENFSS